MVAMGARLTRIGAATAVALLILVIPASDSEPVAAQSPQNFAGSAIRIVSQRERIPETRLRVSTTATSRFTLTNATAFSFKVLDTGLRGDVYSVSLDSTGRQVDVGQLAAAERAAHAARYGKLHPALADRLATAPAAERIQTIVWLNDPNYSAPARPDSRTRFTPEQADTIVVSARAQRAPHVVRLTSPVAERLRRMGHVVQVSTYTPTLYSELTPAVVRQVAGWAEVEGVYMDVIVDNALSSARPSVRADVVEQRGFTGTGSGSGASTREAATRRATHT